MKWLYDIVYNEDRKIVAMMFHGGNTTECLGNLENRKALQAEGLIVGISPSFNTLQEAKDDAWRRKDQFHPSLD